MTDSFIVDKEANYTVGKAQTTPDDESVGVKDSFDNGLGYWDTSFRESAASLDGVVYAGTAMLNRLLEREGEGDIGVITTAGFEDHHRMGRGIACWADLSYAGRLHAREHEHPEPLVPRENIKGVRERVNMFGASVISLYEDEVREAVHDLLDRDVRVIAVCTIFSYANPEHEAKIKEIAEEIKEERDDDTPVWLSSEQNPVRGETPRLNTLILEAYAVEPSREQLYGIEGALQGEGLDAPFRVLTSSGGTIAPDHDWLAETMLSGPIGGVFGGEFLTDKLDIDNLVCSDVGGTSFDVALITEGHYPTRWDQTLAQIPTNIPMTALDSIGSGTGSYLRVDRTSDRIEVGPDSAGYRVGVSNAEDNVETPTVTDCTALLGYINPDFFLGGDIPIDVDAARDAIDEQLASKLGEDPVETARGVLDIVEREMANELRSMVHGLGYAPENYNLISYGGGGPLHTAGYTKPLNFKDILVPDWAAAFSAFGTACADSAYRYDQSVDVILQPDFTNADMVADMLTGVFHKVRDKAADAFARDGISSEKMDFRPSIRAQYTGMLDDLEVQIEELWDGELDGEDIEQIIETFEDEFGRVFQRAARSPENGYQFTVAIGTGVAPSQKPKLPDEEPVSADTPVEQASKGERAIYWEGDWHDAAIWDMDHIQTGNVIEGPAVTEAPATTMLVPPGWEASLDRNRIYHLKPPNQ
jgi:N-methylhydantoinase A/acetone carboxylase beta subunit